MPSYEEIRQRQTRRDRFLETIEDFKQSDPEFLAEIVAALVADSTPRATAGTEHLVPATVINRSYVRNGLREHQRIKVTAAGSISMWMLHQDNEWRTVAEIAEGAALNQNSVGHIVYHSHADRFESRENPDGSRAEQFRLIKP